MTNKKQTKAAEYKLDRWPTRLALLDEIGEAVKTMEDAEHIRMLGQALVAWDAAADPRLVAAHKVAAFHRKERGTRVWAKGRHVRVYGDSAKGCRGFVDVVLDDDGQVKFIDQSRGYNSLWSGTLEDLT